MIKTEEEYTKIELGDKILLLKPVGFSDEPLDVEEILQIDMNNILLDIITFPVLFNRFSVIKTEVDSLLRKEKLDCDIFEANLYKKHKKKLLDLGEKATEGSIDTEIKLDPQYKVKKTRGIDIQRQADILDGLYWSLKSKEKKLDVISVKIQPSEFEGDILKKSINKTLTYRGVVVLVQKNYFENRRD